MEVVIIAKLSRKEKSEWMLSTQVETIREIYSRLYPGSEEAFTKLMNILVSKFEERPKHLREQDAQGSDWLSSSNTVGMMLYVDLFSQSIENLIEKSWYFEKLGITLIHLMPILESRRGENDGGYAVKSYRQIEPKLGDMETFERMVKHYHKKGIRVCIDRKSVV